MNHIEAWHMGKEFFIRCVFCGARLQGWHPNGIDKLFNETGIHNSTTDIMESDQIICAFKDAHRLCYEKDQAKKEVRSSSRRRRNDDNKNLQTM